MYDVGVVGQFEAAHRLRGDFGPATRVHGHTYRVEVTVAGEDIDSDGVLFDIGQLQDALSSAIQPLHYQDLDQLPDLGGENTTAERVSRYLFDKISGILGSKRGFDMGVRVWESPNAFATYRGTLSAEYGE